MPEEPLDPPEKPARRRRKPEPEEKNSVETNGKAGMVAGLLADKDPIIKYATLLFVIVTGGGNFLQTFVSDNRTQEEIRKALVEIKALDDRLDDFETRQKAILKSVSDMEQVENTTVKLQKQMVDEMAHLHDPSQPPHS